MPTVTKINVKKGQIYQENDSRFYRTVEVISVDKVSGYVTVKGLQSGITTKNRIDRFDGGHHNFKLVK